VSTKEHLTKHDREIAAHDKQIRVIRDLVKEGIKLVVTSRQDTRREIRELTAAQKRTDASLKALIDQMRRSGGNGHAKGKVEVQ
jgi:hypothetical protein